MPYIGRSELKQFETHARKLAAEQNIVRLSEKYRAQVTVFLSHSHKDADLVEAVVNSLASFGVKVYIDRLDTEMPAVTSGVTAIRLKEKIIENKKFIVLVSSNAVESKWIPWELGYADGVKELRHIASIPISDDFGHFQGNEYLQMYPQIKKSDQGNWCFFAPGKDGIRIADWLRE
jgi:hypothetical protein